MAEIPRRAAALEKESETGQWAHGGRWPHLDEDHLGFKEKTQKDSHSTLGKRLIKDVLFKSVVGENKTWNLELNTLQNYQECRSSDISRNARVSRFYQS